MDIQTDTSSCSEISSSPRTGSQRWACPRRRGSDFLRSATVPRRASFRARRPGAAPRRPRCCAWAPSAGVAAAPAAAAGGGPAPHCRPPRRAAASLRAARPLDHPAPAYPAHPSEMETLVSNLGTSKHGHLCIYCGKIYSRKYGLKIHIRTHTGYKPLKCKYCLRPFGDPSNLNKHIRLHAEGETPYKCDFCGKVLVRRRDLDRHIRSRHSLNPEDQDTSENLSDDQQESSLNIL
ncbi:Transcription factor hamlet [Gryllus bimaculatus]|nr:Transcription factor hamlet [Gryllus bimaculatus]